MKNRSQKTWIQMLTLFLCLALLPIPALADGAGALSEGELNVWLSQALKQSAEETPMNAPIGEESLTEDGYAFLYSFATFYYDKPVLDAQSVLRAVSLTDEEAPAPRGIPVGSDVNLLLESYGWQNPMLLGDGSFAAFYELDNLPEAAYWSWARLENEQLRTVQCAIHARVSDGRYTDAGILYTVENNIVTSINIYGLDQTVSERDVRSNLNAVIAVEAAITGDTPTLHNQADGYLIRHDQLPFGAEDLAFGGVDYLTLDEGNAERLFGKALTEDRVKDDTNAWLVTTQREGMILSYTVSADGAQTVLDMLSVSGNLQGPRGVHVGMSLEEALSLFYSDGVGTALGDSSILYGNGDEAPTGIMEQNDGSVIVRYRTLAQTAEGETTITLHLSFENDSLTEWMIYSW